MATACPVWVAALVDGALETLLVEDHLGFVDTIGAMEVDGGRVLLVANLGTSSGFVVDVMIGPPTSEIVVIGLDFDGNELDRQPLDVGPLETPIASAVRGVGDRWVVAGDAAATELFQGPQIWSTHADQGWRWDSSGAFGPRGADPGGGASIGGIVMVDGQVVLAGGSYTVGPFEQVGWTMAFDSDGQLQWEFEPTDPKEDHYRETAIATDSSGRIRTAGVGWTDGVSSTLRSCILDR